MIKKGKHKKAVMAIVLVVIIGGAFSVNNYRGIINISREIIASMQQRIPVLAYHGFAPASIKEKDFNDNKWIDDIEGFEQQMKYLHDNGWRTLSLDELYAWYCGDLDVPDKSCVITFDDGYYEIYYKILPILKKYNFNAACFVVGAYTPDITPDYNPEERKNIGWDKIKEVEEDYPKLQFESHSYNLHGFDKEGNEPWKTASCEELRKDFEQTDEYGFEFMAYPYGGYNRKMIKAAKESDIKMAFTFKRDAYAARIYPKYEIPRKKVTAETTERDFEKIMDDL